MDELSSSSGSVWYSALQGKRSQDSETNGFIIKNLTDRWMVGASASIMGSCRLRQPSPRRRQHEQQEKGKKKRRPKSGRWIMSRDPMQRGKGWATTALKLTRRGNQAHKTRMASHRPSTFRKAARRLFVPGSGEKRQRAVWISSLSHVGIQTTLCCIMAAVALDVHPFS